MSRGGHSLLGAAALAMVAAGCGEAFVGDSLTTGGGVDSGPVDPGIDAGATPDAALPPDAAQPPDAAAACVGGDDQAVGSNGNCYLLFTTPVTWDVAAVVCAQQVPTMHLATMTEPVEDSLVMLLAGDQDTWVGGNDKATESVWLWKTSETMTYQNWGVGEPNNGNGNYEEDCMIARKVGSSTDPNHNVNTWDDRPCERTYQFICERE